MKEDGKLGYPVKWQNILTAPLNEGAVDVYLEALNASLVERFIPTPVILQSLLYFTLYPPNVPPRTPLPIGMLYKILSQHDPSDLDACLPVYPYLRRREEGPPRWLAWEVAESTKLVRKTMRRCVDQGIWALLWDGPEEREREGEGEDDGRRRSKRKVRITKHTANDSEEEEEEEEEEKKRVSERGWDLLEWLVAFWEKDQNRHQTLVYSPAFLAQLPKRRDMQHDDASLPLAVIDAAIMHPSPSDSVNRRRLRTAGALLRLLVNAAQRSPKPPFHPATLTLSLLPLLRTRLPELNTVLVICSSLAPRPYCHFMVQVIEDLAGVRARRKDSTRFYGDGGDDDDDPFPPPTIAYTTEVLLFDHQGQDTRDELAVLKLALVARMTDLLPDRDYWSEAADEAWIKQLGNHISGSDVVDAMRRAIIEIFDRLTVRDDD